MHGLGYGEIGDLLKEEFGNLGDRGEVFRQSLACRDPMVANQGYAARLLLALLCRNSLCILGG